jgi:hypothetical protein
MERDDQRFTAAIWMAVLAIFAAFTGLLSPEALTAPESEQNDDGDAEFTSARQAPEADCEGISFEDMFYYDYAEFLVDLDDDWDSADVRAEAFVNGTNGDIVRTDLEELFDGLPNGNNSWLSTDERDGVRTVGLECVVETYTRIGLRDGPSHRGGQGVDWNNLTWINDGMTLEEWNLIPEEHPERQDCQDEWGAPAGSPTCEEIPVVPTNSCGPTSCSIIIWLNGSVEFDQLTDTDDFTLAMVGRNLTNAHFSYTFPEIPGKTLRMANTYEEKDCTGTYTEDDDEEPDYGVTYTTREECASYIEEAGREYDLRAVTGGTQFSTHFTYNLLDWPAYKVYFFDFTTAPPEIDNAPLWTANAPVDGDLLPVASLSVAQTVIGSEQVDSWFTDELGAGLLTIDCTGGSGWALNEVAANTWDVTPPAAGGAGSISCEAVDSAGQSSGVRSFTVASPLTLSLDVTSSLSSVELTVSSTDHTPANMQVDVELVQVGAGISGGAALAQAGSSAISFDLAELSPGHIMVEVTANGDGMAEMSYEYDLGLSKLSIPPTVTITGFEWLEANYILRGNFNDADGDYVAFTLSLDGVQQGQIVINGNQWQTDEIPFDLLIEGIHLVTVEACDTSGECTSVTEEVDNTFLFEEVDTNVPLPTPTTDDGGGLPGPGLGIAVMALIGAGLASRRKRE